MSAPARPRAAPTITGQALAMAARGDRAGAIALLDARVAQVPHDGPSRHVLGVLQLEQGAPAAAARTLEPLMAALDGADPRARVHMANALADCGRADAARPLLEAWCAAHPDDADGWYAAGRVHQVLGDPAAALAAYERVHALAPGHVAAWTGAATAAFYMKDLDRAAAAAERAAALDPASPDAAVNRAFVALARREWATGWAAYEARWRTPALARQWRTRATPRWDGRTFAGVLLVHAEQGLGDTLQGVRWLGAARARVTRLVLAVPAPLVRWLAQAGLADDVVALRDAPPAHDRHLPLWSLPATLGFTQDPEVYGTGAAYLPLPTERPAARPTASGAARRIGLAWAGSATHQNDRHRSAPLDALSPLWDVPGVTWVSLQVDRRGALSNAVGTRASVEELPEGTSDFADTAACLATLDLVISVDSAVAHAAAAAGVPTWLLLPDIGVDWRWFGRDATTPWYAAMRVWRRDAAESWPALAARVAEALSDVPMPPVVAKTVAPPVAREAARRGAAAAREGRWPEAFAALQQAAAGAPQDAAVHVNLATAALKCRRFGEADAASGTAIMLAPRAVDAWVARANALVSLGRETAAVTAAEQAVAIAPRDAVAQRTLARTLERADRLADALARYDALLATAPTDPWLRYNRSLVLLKLGRWTEGWREYEWRWQTPTYAAWRAKWPSLPAWDGRVRTGLRLVVRHEQGAGDTIMAARWLPRLVALGVAVTAQVPPSLVPLLAGQFDGVSVTATTAPVDGDAIVGMLSLPMHLGLDAPVPERPYLQARSVASSPAIPGAARPRYGLVWAGEPSHPFDQLRSLPLEHFASLRRQLGGTWVSLQVGAAARALAQDRETPPLHDGGSGLADYAATAAALDALDALVTVDTSVAHLAGALGVSTTLLLPACADWRWGVTGDRTPWYPAMRVVRGRRLG